MPVSIEIFRPGTHRDMSGESLSFSDGDVASIAAGYDPAAHEAPACVGHPRDDAPAYAWVSAVRFADGVLSADLDQVDPAFAELVKTGRFKKISAAFYRPDSPGNPKPGQYYLRHVGFLGAQPPAIKGLKPVAFATGDDGVFFADWDQLDLVAILRGLREFIIEKFGADEADRVLPGWTLDRLQNSAATSDDPAPETGAGSFAETAPAAPAPDSPELAAERQRLAQAQAALAAERAAFAEQRAASRRTDDARRLDELVRSGRLVPAQRDQAAAFLEVIAEGEVLRFGEGDRTAEQSPRDWFLGFAAGLPPAVTFGEVAVPRDLTRPDGSAYRPPPGYQADPERAELHTAALAYQEAHQGVGYIEAVKAVSKE
jgi:hypothetical protein